LVRTWEYDYPIGGALNLIALRNKVCARSRINDGNLIDSKNARTFGCFLLNMHVHRN